MSLRASLFKLYSRRVIKRSGLEGDHLVRHLRRVFNNSPKLAVVPRGVRIHQMQLERFRGDLVTVAEPKRTILYLHGGAYVGGVLHTYHNLAARLAQRLEAEVWLARYPFAPEHPFPAAVDTCFEAYRFLLDEGRRPEDIVIAGDSAGGGLTLATLLRIRDEKLPRPACAVTLSPAASAFPDETVLKRLDDRDAMLSADMIRHVIDVYIPDEKDRSHPYASPGLADFTGLPPIMITVSNEEVLYGDAVLVREAARKAGVEVEWLEREGVFHVWPVFVPLVPEANEDLREIVAFIRRHVPTGE